MKSKKIGRFKIYNSLPNSPLLMSSHAAFKQLIQLEEMELTDTDSGYETEGSVSNSSEYESEFQTQFFSGSFPSNLNLDYLAEPTRSTEDPSEILNVECKILEDSDSDIYPNIGRFEVVEDRTITSDSDFETFQPTIGRFQVVESESEIKTSPTQPGLMQLFEQLKRNILCDESQTPDYPVSKGTSLNNR